MSEKVFDVAVIGAGAAGLMCAMEAGRRGRRVVLLEHNERVGKKIAISGGGRCNFTNLEAGPDNYLSANPDFCKLMFLDRKIIRGISFSFSRQIIEITHNCNLITNGITALSFNTREACMATQLQHFFVLN